MLTWFDVADKNRDRDLEIFLQKTSFCSWLWSSWQMVYMSQYLGWDVIWHVNWGHDFPAHNGRRCLGSRFVFIMSDQSQSAVLVNFPNTVPARHVSDVWWCGTLLWDGVYRQFNYVLATVWHWRLTIVCTTQHIIPTLGSIHKWCRNIEQPTITQEADESWQGGTKGHQKRWWLMKNPMIRGNQSKTGLSGSH